MQTISHGSSGPDVRVVQSLLNRIGYNAGPVDGIFGSRTYQAVTAFQTNNSLVPDGIVGPATWAVLDRLLRGYDTYTVRPGDTLYQIARAYYTSVDAIITANPGIDPNVIMVGQRLVIPYGIDVVTLDVAPTYEIVQRQIEGLKARYPFLETGSIGRSVMGRELYYIRLGTGPREVSYNASHHANESITTPVLMKFAENYAKAYAAQGSIQGYDIRELYNLTSIYLVPLVNPDGVDLVAYWPNYDDPAFANAAHLNRTGLPLPSVWKANIRGVDLNLNYPADWEKEKEEELEQGITGPAPRDYGGEAPLSEPESRAMADFTRAHNFRIVIAYHTQGEVIYWQFKDYAPPVALTIANQFAAITGYAVEAGTPEAAYAGYKDWFLQEFRRPGYTFEAGRGVNPIPLSQLPPIYQENEGALLLGAVV
ncbi:MAG TPA: M14 family zinc carboxypeptidase [Clostridiales bacterium]|nr:M14 family zinc carboxypeptidase [Clostridiales bacterium]HPZ05656.1 M14 family zinc carboxypeptidase [Clostridiales bacterium]HQD30389.1 M14 family zinc carboxypeptidase [Clostridiales bacterium]